MGSVELEFGIDKLKDFKIFLKSIDVRDFEELGFGHIFPEENLNLQELFDVHGAKAAELFVRYVSRTMKQLREKD